MDERDVAEVRLKTSTVPPASRATNAVTMGAAGDFLLRQRAAGVPWPLIEEAAASVVAEVFRRSGLSAPNFVYAKSVDSVWCDRLIEAAAGRRSAHWRITYGEPGWADLADTSSPAWRALDRRYLASLTRATNLHGLTRDQRWRMAALSSSGREARKRVLRRAGLFWSTVVTPHVIDLPLRATRSLVHEELDYSPRSPEEVAAGLLSELGNPTKCGETGMNAFSIARACRIVVNMAESELMCAGMICFGRSPGDDRNATAVLSPTLKPRCQHAVLAHEIGHFAIQRANLCDPEWAANAVGEALMLPGYVFDSEAPIWDVHDLQRVHVNVSLRNIAHRFITVHPHACISVWRHGKLVARRISVGVPAELTQVTQVEKRLARAAAQDGTARLGPRLVAFVDPEYPNRVVTLSDADQLDVIDAA